MQLGDHVQEVEMGEVFHQLLAFSKHMFAALGGVEPGQKMSGLWPELTVRQGFLEDQEEEDELDEEGGLKGIGEIGELMSLLNVLGESVLSEKE